MAKEDNTKSGQQPLFRKFQDPIQAPEGTPMEKKTPPVFQPIPKFQAPASPPFAPIERVGSTVEPPPVQAETSGAMQKRARFSGGWFIRNKKSLLIGVASILGLVSISLLVLFLMDQMSDDTLVVDPDPGIEKPKSKLSPPTDSLSTDSLSSTDFLPVPMVTRGHGYIKTKDAGSIITLRDKPSEAGTRINDVKDKSFVKVIAYDDHNSKVEGKWGRWCHVIVYATREEGWVWGNYVVSDL